MCLEDQILSTYIDGELFNPWKSQVEEHLSYCSACRKRYEQMKTLSGTMKNAVLSDDEIQPRMDRVLSYFEKNKFNRKKQSWLRRQFTVSAGKIICVAAAFVVIFVGSFSLKTPKDSAILLPEIGTAVDQGNIIPVRASDNNTTATSLDNYSIEELVHAIDAKGFDVDIRLKRIQPLSFSASPTKTVLVAETEKGYRLYSNGDLVDEENRIVATGALYNEEKGIVSTDGETLIPPSEVVPAIGIPENDEIAD